ncbi:radical SAM protein [Duganella violaceipulchra]|uniref:MoaA/NifB/PqqE/SkfB family radical SAM enzyme n=1 Tax=Duganella violaceipulchra TaxID=2849652 RepID=A0AA41L200_9BURK|nr:radical SAM protein [Duganella violaceicalia]MBV6325616.1 radical SAM protein [Duganella violaceicalia]MCP2010929.1 MoaA/NifB/PqqE/SkfB family radical SAM enzyme [Duganella violaceicalia]
MHIQIELTTICNYGCFYCAGRDMEQRDIDMALFDQILHQRLPPGRHRVSLQGEGEPTMHPKFWEMVQAVAALGHTPYTITNGSRMKPDKVAQYFPRIGISIDTIDPDEAERIKRHNVAKVLRNLEALLEIYEPWRVVVHTVDYGQPLDALREYLARLKINKHVVQGLQVKDDYAKRYPGQLPVTFHKLKYNCAYIDQPVMRFFNIDGVEMPCCYIKDASKFTSIEDIRDSLQRKVVPSACVGCNELHENETSRSGVFQIM